MLSESAQNVSGTELDDVYTISMNIEGLIPEDPEYAVDGEVWYQYVHRSYYFKISADAFEQLCAYAENPKE